MANGSYFRFDDHEKIKPTYSHIIERIDLILDTHDSMCLTNILEFQYFQKRLHNDNNDEYVGGKWCYIMNYML